MLRFRHAEGSPDGFVDETLRFSQCDLLIEIKLTTPVVIPLVFYTANRPWELKGDYWSVYGEEAHLVQAGRITLIKAQDTVLNPDRMYASSLGFAFSPCAKFVKIRGGSGKEALLPSRMGHPGTNACSAQKLSGRKVEKKLKKSGLRKALISSLFLKSLI